MNPGAASHLDEAAALITGRRAPEPALEGGLHVGVDLGTAVMVLLVLDEHGRPYAGQARTAHVVRDGLVVDFLGAVDRLRAMKTELEADLGADLTEARSGFPPGVPEPERRAIANVLESAELRCLELVDEPTAANNVLGLHDGALVDVGGGTTGIAVLQDGEVVYTADEATGGTHFNLVIAGALDISYEEAEKRKEDAGEQSRLQGVVRPVMEKVATIVERHIQGWQVDQITLVGGASAFPGFAGVVQEITGIDCRLAPHSQWVTPLGIARSGITTPLEALTSNAMNGSRT